MSGGRYSVLLSTSAAQTVRELELDVQVVLASALRELLDGEPGDGAVVLVDEQLSRTLSLRDDVRYLAVALATGHLVLFRPFAEDEWAEQRRIGSGELKEHGFFVVDVLPASVSP